MTKEERFNKALREFIKALRLHISRELDNEFDGNWEDRYVETLLNHQKDCWKLGRNNGTDPIQLIDYGNLTSFALKNKEFFKRDFGHRINNLPTYFTDINAARNIDAHNLHFDEDKADTAFLNMIYIASKLNMVELVRELRELKEPTENNNLAGQVESVEVDIDKGEVNRERLRKSDAIRLIKEDTTKDFNVVKHIEELPKIKNVSIDVTRKSTRFYLTQSDYEDLQLNPNSFLVIECIPRRNNHPRGKYKIPNKEAREFIRRKQNTRNWDIYANFKQDAIPRGLEEYFTRT